MGGPLLHIFLLKGSLIMPDLWSLTAKQCTFLRHPCSGPYLVSAEKRAICGGVPVVTLGCHCTATATMLVYYEAQWNYLAFKSNKYFSFRPQNGTLRF
jgi:hypothetical protein